MFPRATAGKASGALSLGLIAVVVFALVDQRDRQPSVVPAADPASEPSPAVPLLAQPRVSATRPVVLPPPPPPASKPSAQTPAPQAKQALRSAQTEQDSRPAKKAQSPEPNWPSPASVAKARAPQPQRREPKPEVTPEPPRQAARKEPGRPARAAPPSPTAGRAVAEEPGELIMAKPSDVAEGRTLLRLLEFGSGPTLELAWPDAAGQRESLFALLGQCFGMRVALMDAAGRLYVAEGQPSKSWNLNLDRFSGFIREPAGALSRRERQAAEQIRAHHGGLSSASPVRVFPRTVDARLLGGLRRLVGQSYPTTQAIRARYRVNGGRLVVERIVADGRTVQGRLELPPVARGACRRPART